MPTRGLPRPWRLACKTERQWLLAKSCVCTWKVPTIWSPQQVAYAIRRVGLTITIEGASSVRPPLQATLVTSGCAHDLSTRRALLCHETLKMQTPKPRQLTARASTPTLAQETAWQVWHTSRCVGSLLEPALQESQPPVLAEASSNETLTRSPQAPKTMPRAPLVRLLPMQPW